MNQLLSAEIGRFGDYAPVETKTSWASVVERNIDPYQHSITRTMRVKHLAQQLRGISGHLNEEPSERFYVIITPRRREEDATDRGLLKYQEDLSALQKKEDNRLVSSGAQIAAATLFKNLKNDWELSEKEMVTLLGLDFDASGQEYVENLLNNNCSFSGRDIKDRMAQLIQIRVALFAIFEDHKVENEWLREPQQMLDGKIPMDLLLEGSMENLSLVHEFVEMAAGW